jgi:hypothetical protein
LTPEQETRFWAKVARGPGCWEWTGALSRGYGQFAVGGSKRVLGAHRVSWEHVNGPVPPGLFVLHRCDNPRCVRPDHLFIGTIKDNTADMLAKGRHNPPRGSRCGTSKLTESDAAAIRSLAAEGFAHPIIASRFSVSRPTVSLIVARKTWRHVT